MPRVLYISGSIGLGHAARDLAIADELRRRRTDIEIDWLAGEPARTLLEERGANVLPESSALGETGFAEDQAEEFSLNIVTYVRRAVGAWIRAARAYFRATSRRPYALAIGDETYELAVAFSLRSRFKKLPFTIMYDFLGLDTAIGHSSIRRPSPRGWRTPRSGCLGPRQAGPRSARTAPAEPPR
jgi:UDP:flavonoid glycosyltransferase YjiC (YdhE family)